MKLPKGSFTPRSWPSAAKTLGIGSYFESLGVSFLLAARRAPTGSDQPELEGTSTLNRAVRGSHSALQEQQQPDNFLCLAALRVKDIEISPSILQEPACQIL